MILLNNSWWPETESNRRHEDFQSSALPTELSGPNGLQCNPNTFWSQEFNAKKSNFF